MKLGEFFVSLGVNTETTKVRDFGRAIGDLPIQAAGAIVALAGLTLKIKELLLEGIATADAMEKFALRTGLSAQELNKWQIVAAQANMSAEEMSTSVESLQRNLAEIKLGRGNIAPFQLLGISAAGDAFTVLEQLRRKVKNLPSATATNLISQMGLSPDTIKVLRLTDAEFNKFAKTAHGMGKEQQEAFLRVKLAATQLGLVFRDVVWSALSNLLGGFDRLKNFLQDLHFAIPALIALVVALGIAFFPVTAAVTALILLLEDLAVFASGGDSLMGKAMKALTGRTITPAGLKESLKTITSDDGSTIGKVLADIVTGGFKNVGAVEERSYMTPGAFRERVTQVDQKIHAEITIQGSDNPRETGEATAAAIQRTANDASLQIPAGDQ